jgi:hypothetical protein
LTPPTRSKEVITFRLEGLQVSQDQPKDYRK